MKRHHLLFLLALLSLPLAPGCTLFSPRPEPSKFYVLTALAASQSTIPAAPAPSRLAIGLGPVNMPDYLEHLEVVTRVASNRIELSSTDRWAEPLDESFRRVLARNLAMLLGTDQVVLFPWYASARLDYKIELTVDRFERDGAGGTLLAAQWVIRDGRSGRLLLARQSNFAQSIRAQTGAGGGEMERAAAALSADLGDLSKQIADAVTELNQSRNRQAAK
jgi:uncharacterized lipoprotein YmbA